MDNRPVWKHTQFVKFFHKSPRLAYEYRKNALWCEIPEEYMTEEEKQAKILDLSNDITSNDTIIKEDEKTSIIGEEKEDILENDENSWDIEFTRADLIEKLENASITYIKTSKDETLLRKCIENNLLN